MNVAKKLSIFFALASALVVTGVYAAARTPVASGHAAYQGDLEISGNLIVTDGGTIAGSTATLTGALSGAGSDTLSGVGVRDYPISCYSATTAVATTGTVCQVGALTKAATLLDCSFTPSAVAVGTGTQTFELCNGTGITSSNCTGTKFATIAVTSASAVLTPVAATINTASVPAGALPTFVLVSSTIATTNAVGNAVCHFKE